ncbi:MAG: hypothetical protein LBG84_06995 [Treponema sp.]|jgi:hypothetical protein|nr:hypothetical protein [Treponema sp.]
METRGPDPLYGQYRTALAEAGYTVESVESRGAATVITVSPRGEGGDPPAEDRAAPDKREP